MLLLEFHPVLWTSTNSFTQHPHPAGLQLLLCYKTATQALVRIVFTAPSLLSEMSPSLLQSSQHPDLLGCLSPEPELCSSVLPSWKLQEPVSPQNEILLPGSLVQLHKDSGITYSWICMAWRGSNCHQRLSKTPCKDVYRPFKSSR